MDKRESLYRAGFSDREIAEQLGKSRSAVTLWRLGQKLPPNPAKTKRYKERERAKGLFKRGELVALYEGGIPVTRIAELDGTDPITVHHHIRRNRDGGCGRFGLPLGCPPMDDAEKAYLAGLMDGEGAVQALSPYTRSTGEKVWYARVSIGMTHLDTIDWIHSRTGIGCLHAPKPTNDRQQAYYWIATSRPAIGVLEAIRPWLRTKAAQADWVLSAGHALNESQKWELTKLNAASSGGRNLSDESRERLKQEN
jgi:hypothetical protein